MNQSRVDAPCEALPWDSTFFSRRIARVSGHLLTFERAAAINGWCREHPIDCLYFLADASDPETVRLAAVNGFVLVDIRLTFGRALTGLRCESAHEVRPAAPEDVPGLRAIAERVHTDTRFYFDPGFPRSLCGELYATWIEKSCSGYADATLTCGPIGDPLGYIACSVDPSSRYGQIGLTGVAEKARGRGIGSALVQAALQWFAEQGCPRAAVVTQGCNSGAQRLYQKHGFRTELAQLWYHKWFPAP